MTVPSVLSQNGERNYPKISEKCSKGLLLKLYRLETYHSTPTMSATLETTDGTKRHVGFGTDLLKALQALEQSL